MIEKWLKYLDYDLWNFPLSQKRGFDRFRLKWLRLFYLSLRNFFQDHCTLYASSLTYYTLISIVPAIAMSLAVAGGFGYREVLREEILSYGRDQKEAFSQIIQFADQLLDQTRGGVIAGVGLLILFWSVASLIHSMEEALNQIWSVKKTRSWRRIFSDYFSLMLIAPFLFLLSSSATVFVVGQLDSLVYSLPFAPIFVSSLHFFVHLMPYVLFWGLFTFIFMFIPNVKVRFRSAFVGGAITGTLYLIVQWGYIYFQVGASRYGAIYGSFAALPLFLIWIQLSWFLVLLGAEVSYAHQTLEQHEFERAAEEMSFNLKRLLCLWITFLIVRHFESGKGPMSHLALLRRRQIPHHALGCVLQELIECHIILEVKGGNEHVAYVPARSCDTLTVSDVCEALESKGVQEWPWIESKAWIQLEKTLHRFQNLLKNTSENQRLKDYQDE